VRNITLPVVALVLAAGSLTTFAQSTSVRATLTYQAPGDGKDGKPAPNFSPKGTQVKLTDLAKAAKLPPGATRPARAGVMEVGPSKASWFPILASAGTECPSDLCRIYIDRNRNRNFSDDGPALTAAPTQNARTKAWWTSIDKVQLSIPYGRGVAESYLVNFWAVRDDGAPAPEIIRFSVGSWRQGTVKVNGVDALVAVMDSNNDAVFTKADTWSVIAASEANAAKAVLSLAEARPANRLMFIASGGKETAVEFRSVSADGRSIDFVVIDRGITKALDRAPDDLVRDERSRPRARVPLNWGHNSAGLTAALAKAKAEGKRVFIDFEATWCGPCHTMDEWIWSDLEVATRLEQFVVVKVDADLEKAIIKKYAIAGYPTMMVVDASGKELKRVVEYQSSKQMLQFLSGF